MGERKISFTKSPAETANLVALVRLLSGTIRENHNTAGRLETRMKIMEFPDTLETQDI